MARADQPRRTTRGRALTLLALAALGCGRSTLLADESEDAAGGRGGQGGGGGRVTQPSCATRWGACVPATEAVTVSQDSHSQSPDVAWSGHHALVVYKGDVANQLVAVAPSGEIAWREPLDGIQSPHIAFAPWRHAGVVMVDAGIQWLDADGRPAGAYVDSNPHSDQSARLDGGVAPIEQGFVAMSGVSSYATPPPLYAARLGAQPATDIAWQLLDLDGPRSPPAFALDLTGRATWAASSIWWESRGELYALSSDGSAAYAAPLVFPSESQQGIVESVASLNGQLYELVGDADGWRQYVVRQGDGEWWRIDLANNGSDGRLFVLGDTLLVASSAIHPDYHVSIAAFDPATGNLGPLRTLSGSFSQTARLARTDQGFVVTWAEVVDGISQDTRLQFFNCCIGR